MATTEEIVLPKVSLAAKEGKLDNLQIEYWVGGGQPPPFYRSEQFRLLPKGGKPQMEFAVLRFHPKLTPSEVTEKYTLPADPADIKAVGNLLVANKVFEVQFPEESNPSIGSVITHELIATVDASELKRVYYRTMPAVLAPLEKVFQQLINRTRDKGRHSWHHQGRKIDNPFAGEK